MASSGKVILVTCVTNKYGYGPGHSAIAINNTVYTFENYKDYGSSNSGWLAFGLTEYLEKNTFRPVILQMLGQSVDAGKALQYINKSRKSEDDYLSSGVCSSQAASTINAGYSAGSFNTWGVDTPYDIYRLAHKLNLVDDEQMFWPDRDTLNSGERTRIEEKLDEITSGLAAAKAWAADLEGEGGIPPLKVGAR